MAQVTVPPVGDLVSGLPLPPTQRVAHHDQIVDADIARARSNRWLRPVADITASLLALVIATVGGAAVQTGSIQTVPVRPAILVSIALAWPLFLAANGWFTRRPLGEPMGDPGRARGSRRRRPRSRLLAGKPRRRRSRGTQSAGADRRSARHRRTHHRAEPPARRAGDADRSRRSPGRRPGGADRARDLAPLRGHRSLCLGHIGPVVRRHPGPGGGFVRCRGHRPHGQRRAPGAAGSRRHPRDHAPPAVASRLGRRPGLHRHRTARRRADARLDRPGRRPRRDAGPRRSEPRPAPGR